MREILAKIMNNYLIEKKNKFAKNYLANLIRDFGRNLVGKINLSINEYMSKGSAGMGSWEEVPWLAVFDKSITKNAQSGYYIVYLFCEDMSKIYITLALGVEQFSRKEEKIKIISNKCRHLLSKDLGEFDLEKIHLSLTNSTAKNMKMGLFVVNVMKKKIFQKTLN